MRAPLRAALAVLAILAGGHAAAAQEAIDKARTAAFDKRLFAGALSPNTTYACFVRVYDAGHLARHPKQKVVAMKLLVSAENPPDEQVTNYSFRLGVKFRHRSGQFDSSGSCNHFTAENTDGEIRLGCGVDCDGGGLATAVSNDDKSAIVHLARIRIWQNSKPNDEGDELVTGADDKTFRLDRVDARQCASLVTDRKELAALRRK